MYSEIYKNRSEYNLLFVLVSAQLTLTGILLLPAINVPFGKISVSD